MTIQAISSSALALYLTPCDLQARGLDPGGLDLPQAMALAREACQSAGLSLPEPLEIEAYPDKAGILVFAQVQPAPLLVFSFSGLPELLDALALLPEPPKAAQVTYWQNQYFLMLRTERQSIPPVWHEFGTEESAPGAEAQWGPGEPVLCAEDLIQLYLTIRQAP